jgi:hypothetical protein
MTPKKLFAWAMGIFTIQGFFFILISGIIGAFLWPYSLNSWLLFIGKHAKVLWWHGFILGVIPGFGAMSIPIAVITWIAMLFLT